MGALDGKIVVVTRPRSQSGALREELAAAGAKVIETPAIRFTAVDDLRDWRLATQNLSSYSHILFTSRVAASFFAEFCEASAIDISSWKDKARVGALGGRTAKRLAEVGLPADFVGKGSGATAFAEETIASERLNATSRVLLPQSDIARPTLRDALVTAGATVDVVALYETRSEEASAASELFAALDRGEKIAAVTFASPSALRGFLELTEARGRALLESSAVRIVTIGPTTTQAVRDAGLREDAEAKSSTPRGIVDAIR